MAEAIWGLDPGDCQPAWYMDDPILHELDGIARLRDITHLIMATTSRKLEKAISDVKKLTAAAQKEQKRGVPVEKWFITEYQLEAEHLEACRKHNVKVLTLDQFRNRFFDGRNYLVKRSLAPFGSARNLRNGSISIPIDEYVELPMSAVEVSTQPRLSRGPEQPIDLQGVVNLLEEGKTVVLVGPFGAGKSLTTRELFYKMKDQYLKGGSVHVPIVLNLREHWGAVFGDEILERHARSLGFLPRENLTIAWRAGIALLQLDGFDELASQAIARPSDKHFMRQARQQALQAVRDLVGKVQEGTGVLLCGRDHYFDSLEELAHSLGIARAFVVVKLYEFTEDQANEFLKRRNKSTTLPDWLPRKPLILGYLAHQELLDDVLNIDASQGFGYAWDSFLDLVCNREAEHERSVMEPRSVRRVLERLACIARGNAAGTGPLTGLDLAEAYRAETGDVAGEGVLMQLQRLPGLTPREQDPTARSFVDEDMLAALNGSAVARAIIEDSIEIVNRRWLSGLTRDGIRMAAHRLRSDGYNAATVIATAQRFVEVGHTASEARQLAADCFVVAAELARDDGKLDARGLLLVDSHINTIDVEDQVIVGLTLQDCAIETLNLGPALHDCSILFNQCLIQDINGVQSEKGLPSNAFQRCEFGRFDDASTNAAVLRLPIQDSLKALMTVLRKLYLQAGGGRRMSALKRGLPTGRVFDLVSPVVGVLESEGMVAISGDIVHPIRKQTARVNAILAAGDLSDDNLVKRVRLLDSPV